MNENADRTSSPLPKSQKVAALTGVFGGGSPQKKLKPPLSPMERTLSENRKGGFSSPPARKTKVFKSPVTAAPEESSDDSDSDDDAPKAKPPKPGSFEDSFNKLMASSSSYDEVESDSDSDSDKEAAAKKDKSKGAKVRSTPDKSTSNDPNVYSSSERGVSTSDDDDDSSSSSDSSDSEDSASSEDSDDSSDSSTASSEDGKGKPHDADIQSESERLDDDDVAAKSTTKKGAQNRGLVESGYKSYEEDLKSEDYSSSKAADATSTHDNTTHSAWSQNTNDTVALGDVEEDDVLQHRKLQESEPDSEDSQDAMDSEELTDTQTDDEAVDAPIVAKRGGEHPKSEIDAQGLIASERSQEHPDDEEEHLVSAGDYESILPPGSIDGMENFELYVDSDTDNDEKSRLSHDTPFAKNALPRGEPSSDQDLDGAGMQNDDHRAVQVESTEKSSAEDETEVEDSEEESRPRQGQEQPTVTKELQKEDHDEELGSQGESELSDEMDDEDEEDEEDEKNTRRRRCILIMCCLACIVLLAIVYTFVWVFVIHKNNDSAKPADVKQLVGELYGAVAAAQLGAAVAVSGDGLTIAAGAPGFQATSGANVGQVRVLSRQGPTLSEWAQIGQLLQGDRENDSFGSTVSLSSNGAMLAIGAAKRDGLGYVRVFNLTTTSQWQHASSDILANQTNSGFGVSLAVSSNGLVVAVGAPNHLDPANSIRTGEVRVYGLFDQAWRLLGEPLVGQANGDGFGSSVSLSTDGRIVAVGSPGNSLVANSSGLVQTFLFNIPGNFWQQVGSNIKGDKEFDRLGVSVSLSSDGQTLAAGMVTNDSRGGMVRAYHLGSDSTWTQLGNGVAGEQPFSQWGYSVALSNDGSRVVAGAPLTSTVSGQRSGRVRVFDVTSGNWNEVGTSLSGKDQGDNFGLAVSISGNGKIIYAGAPNFTNTFYRPNGAQLLAQAGYAQVYEIA